MQKKYHSTTLKSSLSDLLIHQGYPSYAIALTNLEVEEVDFEGVAYIENNKKIVLSTNTMRQGDNVISLVTRHEILHYLLNHTHRVKKIQNPDYRLYNIAADLELSNYYSDLDSEILNTYFYLKGSVSITLPEYDKYKNIDAEEIYDLLKENNQDCKSFSECISEESGEESEGDVKTILGNIKEDVEKINNVYKSTTEAIKISDNVKSGNIVFDSYHEILFDIESEYKDILRRKKKRNFKKENEIYSSEGIIFSNKSREKQKQLTLNIFRDVSGSMTPDKTNKAVELVTKLADNKNVVVIENIFSDNINSLIGGGTNYDAIIQYCKRNSISDIVIITDDDSDNIVTDYTFNKVFVIGVQGTKDNLKNIKTKTTLKHYTL